MIIGIAALLFTALITIRLPPDPATPWLHVAIYLALFILARLSTISFHGTGFSLSHVILVSAFLTLDLTVALWIGFAGTLVEHAARLALYARRAAEPGTARDALGAAGAALGEATFSMGAAGPAFYTLGGETPITEIDLSQAVPILALFVVYSAADTLFQATPLGGARAASSRLFDPSTTLRAGFAQGRRGSRLSARDWLRQYLRTILVSNLLLLPLALIIASIYVRTDFPVFLVFVLFLVVVTLLIGVLGAAQWQLEKRLRERASVSAIGQALTSSLDLPELLEAIHKQIGSVMDVRNFYVALYNEDYDELSFPLVYEDGQAVRYRSRMAGNGLTEHVLHTRAPLLIPSDVAGAIRRLGLESIPGKEAHCWLGVPITTGERVLGVIAVQSHAQSNAYDADDVDLLTTIAIQTAVAIENAQLYASTRRRAAELAILNSVSTVVGSSLNLDQVMEAVVGSVGPVVGCQKAAILLLQNGGLNFAPTASRGLGQHFLQKMPAMLRLGRGEKQAAGSERQPLVVNDARADPRFEQFRALIDSESIRSFADMPLHARDHVIGTLAVFYTEPHRFTVADLDLLTTFANQAAVAVANASLYAQTDLALAQRIEELAALEEIGRELTSTLDFNRVIERVLDAAVEFAGASRGLVALHDAGWPLAVPSAQGQGFRLGLVAVRGSAPGTFERSEVESWLGRQEMIAAVIRDGTVQWIEDVRGAPALSGSPLPSAGDPSTSLRAGFAGQAYKPNDPETRSALAVPIVRDGQPLGVIVLESTRRAAFNEASARFIGQLATQAAVAIHNAQLHEQTQGKLREMSILFELSREVTAILDLPELGREIAGRLAQALGTTHCAIELMGHNSERLERIAEHVAPEADAGDPSTALRAGLPPEVVGAIRSLDVEGLRQNRQPVILYAAEWPLPLPHAHPLRAAQGQGFGLADVEILRAHNLCSLIGLPLIAGNQVIGRVLWMDGRQRAPFSADEIRFAETLANQASIALENARLFRERARRVNDLAQLYQASLALASSFELEEALNRIAVVAREITDSDSVAVYLYDGQTDSITHGSQLVGSSRRADVSMVRPHGMTRRIIRTRQPMLVHDTHLEREMNPRVLEAGIRSVIGMPIIRKGEVLGVVYVNSRAVGKYTADSVQLLQLLANDASVAIENAGLFSRMAETRDRLAAILNSSRDGVLMFDVSGRIIVANPMIEQMWSMRRSELEGQSLARLLEAPGLDLPALSGYSRGALRALLEQATRGVHVVWGKEVFTLPGALGARWIERTGAPVLDENGGLVGWMLVFRDVTEERELQVMREDLTNMIVHDLRSPLVAILDAYELIGESLPADVHTGLTGKALDVGQRSTRKLLDLVNSLLDMSRFEHGQVSVDTQFAALRPLTENALAQLAPMLADRGLVVHNDVPADMPLVKVDEDQITRVLINLIDNAVKFSPQGGRIVITARPGSSHDGVPSQNVVCSVRDMGPGVPAEYRERIFERFVHLSDGLERRRGTGLGLAFCKMAIEAHGGSIWIEEPPEGQGSQFSFTLPVADLQPIPP
ncbi:MAG TPA: GAF domain-containing protein [Anaerolineae bacterium]|nr:GAF domain-containing protein [Anaerolineae bacterium]